MRRATLATNLRIVAAIAVLVAPASGFAPQPQPRQSADKGKRELSAEARGRVRKAIAAVGLILVRNAGDSPERGARPRGSAVIIRQDGIVATNYHVIARDKSDRLYDEIFFSLANEDGGARQPLPRFRLEPVVLSKDYDLALLRIQAQDPSNAPPPIFPAVELADMRSVELLDEVVIIGFPEKGGATVTVNTGVIEGKDTRAQWIKTDARLIHGNSGGAAVASDGKLVGIPTKVEVDRQPVERPSADANAAVFGAVGFLRPASLLAAMLDWLGKTPGNVDFAANPAAGPSPSGGAGAGGLQEVGSAPVLVRGDARSAVDDKPIAGVRVGVVALGTVGVSAENLLAWGGSNAEGRFELNRPIAPGRYTLRAKAIGYEALSLDVEIGPNAPPLILKLRPGR